MKRFAMLFFFIFVSYQQMVLHKNIILCQKLKNRQKKGGMKPILTNTGEKYRLI